MIGNPARRAVAAAGALLAVATVAGGCSTTVTGRAHPSECARHDLADCAEYVPAAPSVEAIVAGSDRFASAQQLCSMVPDEALRRLLGGKGYRVIRTAGAPQCVLHADQPPEAPRLSVALSAFPAPMQGYAIVDGNERVDLPGGAGPAWRNDDSDPLGNRRMSYTISTSGDPNTGGVLFVEPAAELPRGTAESDTPPPSPEFDRHAEIAAEIVQVLRRTPA